MPPRRYSLKGRTSLRTIRTRRLALQEAEKAGKFAFGESSNTINFGPKAQLTANIANWAPYYTARIQAVIDRTWKSEDTWDGVGEKMIVMAPFTNMPEDVKATAEKTVADIASGAVRPFACPVLDQQGQDHCKPGAKALDDGAVLGMNWYVQGVEDKIPQ